MYEDLFNEGSQYDLTDKMLAAIAQRESGGVPDNERWDFENSIGAHGPWQIMPDTYSDWSSAAGVSPNDYSPAAQTAVARAMMSHYIDKYGLRGAAQAWLGGEGSVGNDDASDGYTTTGQYADDVLGYLGSPDLRMPSSNGYSANILQTYKTAGGKFNNPNEPFDSNFIKRVTSQPTVNASERVFRDYLSNASPELTATAMGVYNRNKDFFNEFNKLSAASAKEGADIENKNRQKTVAAQFADQIANSNSNSNIAMYSALGKALTGVNFPGSNPALADMGQMAIQQINADINANKQRQADAFKQQQLDLDKAKLDSTNAYNQFRMGLLAQGASSSGGAGGAGGNATPNEYGYVLENEDDINSKLEDIIGSPQHVRNSNIILDPNASADMKKMALDNDIQTLIPYIKTMQQAGLRETASGIINGPLFSSISNYVEQTQPAGNDPKDKELQEQAKQDILKQLLNTPDGGYTDTSGNYVASTPASRQRLLEATTNQVANGQLVNRF